MEKFRSVGDGLIPGLKRFNLPHHPPIYGVLSADQYYRHLTHVSVVTHLVIVTVYCIETHLILNAEYKDDDIYPVRELKYKQEKTFNLHEQVDSQGKMVFCKERSYFFP